MGRAPRNVHLPYTVGTAPHYADSSLALHLAGATVTVCTCWKLTPLTNGVPDPTKAVGATSHGRDLTLSGHGALVFRSTQGVVPTAVDHEAGQTSAGLDVETLFDGLYISEAAADAGDYDGARFEVFVLNYKVPEMGEYVMFAGSLGNIQGEGYALRAEGAPWSTVTANRQLGRTTTAKCDVREFADLATENRCKLDPAGNAPDGQPLTVSGSVTSLGADNGEFFDSARTEAGDRFTDGVVTWLTGLNAGRKFEVKTHASGTGKFVLQRATPKTIQVGDTYSVIRGCNRTPGACESFNNIINFRGFRFVKPPEQVVQIRPA